MKTTRLFVLLTFVLCLCPYAQSQADKWNDLTQHAAQLASAGRFLEALPVAQQAVQEAQTVFTDQSVNYGLSVGGVGYIQMMIGRNAEAEKNLLKAETIISAAVGSDSAPIQQTFANLAQLYYNEATQATSKSPQQLAFLSKSENYAKRNSDLFYKLKPGR